MQRMNLYLISQDKNSHYDTYDSAVVAAPNTEAARMIHPSGAAWIGKQTPVVDTWADADDVAVKLIGTATTRTVAGVVCASFNAG